MPKALIVKAVAFKLQMANGRMLTFPKTFGMIHDPSGVFRPRCSVYVGPFKKQNRPVEHDRTTSDYFGGDYELAGGKVDLPPAWSTPWRYAGRTIQIFYYRKGKHKGGYYHKTKMEVDVYKHGRWTLLKMPNNCIINWRGFVYP